MQRTLLLTLVAAITGFIMNSSAAASQGAGISRIPTVTRLVVVFSHLEDKLSDAAQKHDKATVSHLLDQDFEMRVAAMPGRTIPRSTWIQQSFDEPKSSRRVEQMAVHQYGNIAIASFLWRITPTGPGAFRRIFVVDIWRQESGTWKLAVRYAGPAVKGPFPIPGAPADEPAMKKKE